VNELTTTPNVYEADRLEVAVKVPGGAAAIISRFLTGGEVQGVLDVRTRVIDSARNQLGLLARGIAETFNDQHRLGMDLNGQLGGDFFAVSPPVVLPATGNAGSVTAAISVTDAGALKATDYRLNYDGSQWQLTRLSDNAVTTGPGPFSLDGLAISVAGAATAGDSFLLRPAQGAGAGIELAVGDISKIAAAAPVRGQLTVGNGGNLAVSGLTVADASSLPLAGPITLTFNPDAFGPGVPGFDVSGGPAGPLAYDPATESSGKSFALSGYGDITFTLKGTPQTGDSVSLGNNLGGVGDNRNALLLAGLQTQRIFNGGATTYRDAYASLVSDIGVKSRQANNGLATETALLEHATAARDAVSGVSLEEEAANLVRLQQAYQAAAQIVAMADSMFQTLIDATRR
jgi:flagellar hook-associated protein 1 FlgK